jgi:P27 family predicted phage terminase small subunit
MRRPKPTHLKILEGNRGHRPINRREPHVTAALGDAPHWFNADMRATWDHAKEHCPANMLKETDRDALIAFCVHEFNFVSSVQAMAGQPLTVRQPSGRLVENPLGPRIRAESQAMARAIDQLGFSPAARTRVHVDISEPDNEFDDVAKPTRRAG